MPLSTRKLLEIIATETRCKNWWNGHFIPFKFCVAKECKCEQTALKIKEIQDAQDQQEARFQS